MSLERLQRAKEFITSSVTDFSVRVKSKAVEIGQEVFKTLSEGIKDRAPVKLKPESTESSSCSQRINNVQKEILPPLNRTISTANFEAFSQNLSSKLNQQINNNPTTLRELTSSLDREARQILKAMPNDNQEQEAISPDLKERISLLTAMREKIERNPALVREEMNRYQNFPEYKEMGAVKFLSTLAKIDQDLKQDPTALKPVVNNAVPSKDGPKTLRELTKIVDNEARAILKEIPESGYLSAEIKESIGLMTALREKIQLHPGQVEKEIASYQNTALYQHMGAYRFLSILAKVDSNAKEMGFTGPRDAISEVALMGYSLKDYNDINPALRQAKGGDIQDAGLRAYAKAAADGLAKLPDIDIPPEGVKIQRAIFSLPQDIAEGIFIKNGYYNDFAFTSTTPQFTQSGQINLTFIPAEGSKTMPGKALGPCTFWSGEVEILFPPGTNFRITEVIRNSKEEITGATLQCLSPDEKNEAPKPKEAPSIPTAMSNLTNRNFEIPKNP